MLGCIVFVYQYITWIMLCLSFTVINWLVFLLRIVDSQCLKKKMDTENCSNLYLQTCQTFLTCNYNDPKTFEDLYRLLPWFRQSLTCCICSNVLDTPMSSNQSHCQHFICKWCVKKFSLIVLKMYIFCITEVMIL